MVNVPRLSAPKSGNQNSVGRDVSPGLRHMRRSASGEVTCLEQQSSLPYDDGGYCMLLSVGSVLAGCFGSHFKRETKEFGR